MAKTNYRQAKRNREETRKKRQIEKRQKKLVRSEDSPSVPDSPASEAIADPKVLP
jgi:hypothetical protein